MVEIYPEGRLLNGNRWCCSVYEPLKSGLVWNLGMAVNSCVTLADSLKSFSYLKMEKYKYMSLNIGSIKWDDLYKICSSRRGLNKQQLLQSFISVYSQYNFNFFFFADLLGLLCMLIAVWRFCKVFESCNWILSFKNLLYEWKDQEGIKRH